jgi:archaeosine synthase
MVMEVETYLIKRDGWARIAEFRIENRSYISPSVIDIQNQFLDELNFDLVPYSLKDFDPERFNRLFSEDENFIIGTGLHVLPPSRLVEFLIELRSKSYFKPLYVPALATPQNLPVLAYFGVDFVDDIIPLMAAYKKYYLLENGYFMIDRLKEIPCSCEACRGLKTEERREMSEKRKVDLLKKHNCLKLEEQAILVREHIRNGTLRNFVETRVKSKPELTVMLRKADQRMDFFEKTHPRFKRSTIFTTALESFSRPEIVFFLKRIAEVYEPSSETLLLLPCTARKPYSLSKTHRLIRNSLGGLLKGIDEIIISSPLVCPREFELTYPAMAYDTPVTGIWGDEEVDFVAENLAKLIKKDFDRIIAHVEGGYRKVVEKAAKIAGFEPIFTAEGQSIKNLKKELEKSVRVKKDSYLSLFRHMFRYQFDAELDDFLDDDFLDSYKIKGKYPNLMLFQKERVLRVDMNYGMLDVDLQLAQKLIEMKSYTVKIGDFEPKGTIFSAGVEKADERIRPNDIVFFENDNFIGVGRAFMTGNEMMEAEKGVAVEVKRKKKRST